MAALSSLFLLGAILILGSDVQSAIINRADSDAVICYFGSWATYRTGIANFEVSNIDAKLCTHIVYAYTGLKNGVIASLDEYNDYEENWGKGNMKKFVALAEKNKIKALVGIGGWNEGSAKYSQMASTEKGREAFADSVVAYIQKFGFHGLALDWTYPTQRGGVEADKENYVLLLQTLSEKFSEDGLVLTIGTGVLDNMVDTAYDIPNIAKYVDYIVAWTYDYHSYIDGVTFVSSPLTASDKLNVEYSIKNLWIEGGAPANKLILSISAYGRTSKLLDPNKHGLEVKVLGPGNAGPFSQEPGLLTYLEYCTDPDWTVVNSSDPVYVYAYQGAQWISYDDADTVAAKAEFVKKNGLGGMMLYSMEDDDFEGNCGSAFPLLTAINEGLERI